MYIRYQLLTKDGFLVLNVVHLEKTHCLKFQLLWWDKRLVKVYECVGDYTLAVSFKNIVHHSIWALAGVYGPNSSRDRRLLWDELVGLRCWWNLPWRIGGDFNVTCFSSERSGEARLCTAMMEFSNFIFYQGLLDLPLVGGSFTWSISQDPPMLSKIDRFLISLTWGA